MLEDCFVYCCGGNKSLEQLTHLIIFSWLTVPKIALISYYCTRYVARVNHMQKIHFYLDHIWRLCHRDHERLELRVYFVEPPWVHGQLLPDVLRPDEDGLQVGPGALDVEPQADHLDQLRLESHGKTNTYDLIAERLGHQVTLTVFVWDELVWLKVNLKIV